MRRNVLLISMVVSMLVWNLSFASDLDQEKVEFNSPEAGEYKIIMFGCFSKSGIAVPNDILFQYRYFTTYLTGGIKDFTYSGRTGDKTFEIIYKTSDLNLREKEREKINLFFEENGSCPLPFVSLFSGCSVNEKILLKMIRLQGNQLEYQIILPNCLKRQEKKIPLYPETLSFRLSH
jgi:hypothetical protein